MIGMTLSCWFDFLTFILYTVYTPDGMVDTPMKQCMDADNLDRRLKNIGQVQAIDRMVDEDVPCEDILLKIMTTESSRVDLILSLSK